MSQIQPLLCAVEMVCEAIGAVVGSAYGTCSASARVVEQHVLLRHERHAVVPAQQQRLHAACSRRTDRRRARRGHAVCTRGDVAVVVRVDADHVIEHVAHAELLDAVLAQEHAELAGVEVIGVVGDRRVFGRRRPAWAPCRARTGAAGSSPGPRTARRRVAPASPRPGWFPGSPAATRTDESSSRRSRPSTQRSNFEPCLNEASHSRMKSVSVTPMLRSVSRMVGQVPSPTPIGRDVGRLEQRDSQARAGARAVLGRDARRRSASRPSRRRRSRRVDLLSHADSMSRARETRKSRWGTSGSSCSHALEAVAGSSIRTCSARRSCSAVRSASTHNDLLVVAAVHARWISSVRLIASASKREVLVDVVAGIQVQLAVSLDVHRVRQAGAVEAAGQELVTPVVGRAHLDHLSFS